MMFSKQKLMSLSIHITNRSNLYCYEQYNVTWPFSILTLYGIKYSVSSRNMILHCDLSAALWPLDLSPRRNLGKNLDSRDIFDAIYQHRKVNNACLSRNFNNYKLKIIIKDLSASTEEKWDYPSIYFLCKYFSTQVISSETHINKSLQF